MEILKSEQYISEKLNIKPVSKDMLGSFKEPEVDDKTRRFIEDNNLVWNPLTKCYDCDGDIEISKDIVYDGKLKIRFGKVNGDFVCINRLTTLEGVPQEIAGDFYCINNKLTTLEGAPQEVGGDFVCSGNRLTTIKGSPQKVGGDFICSNNKLTTLDGAPQEIGGDFYCNDNELTNLKGVPQKVNGNFECSHNKLTTLEYAPNEVGGDFYCSNNPNLVLPKEKPSWIKGKIRQ